VGERVLATGRRHIVIVTEDSKPALGGIAEYLHQLAIAASATHDVTVVSCLQGAGAVRVPGSPAVQYRELHWHRSTWRLPGDSFAPWRKVNTLYTLGASERRVQRALAALAAERPDTSFVLGRLSVVTHPWCEAFRALGIPYLGIAYGLELLEVQHRPDITDAVHWFPISRHTSAMLSERGVPASRQTLLMPGVIDTGGRDRSDGHYLLTACLLRKRKGVDLAIQAFANVARSHDRLRYVIVGEGPEKPALQRLAAELGVADRITFAGAVDDATRDTLFAGCTAYIMPNRALPNDVEGFGITFLEAAIYAKPVIGGNNGGVPDAVVSDETGVLVDTDRGPEDLTNALRRLLDEPAWAHALGEAGRARACAAFDWPSRGATFTQAVDAAR
jgi:glycosyltransferase involved in cell wall biosynthesis